MERVEPPADIWCDPRVATAASRIAGEGLFATGRIAAGEVVIRLGGRLMSTEQLEAWIAQNDADPDGVYVDSITIYEDAHLVLPPGTVAHFGNHSCDPSTWLSGPYELTARRDLRVGDELTLDYGTISGAPGFWMACTCGSGLCRGETSSNDWRLSDLQQRYAGHWPPALDERITALHR